MVSGMSGKSLVSFYGLPKLPIFVKRSKTGLFCVLSFRWIFPRPKPETGWKPAKMRSELFLVWIAHLLTTFQAVNVRLSAGKSGFWKTLIFVPILYPFCTIFKTAGTVDKQSKTNQTEANKNKPGKTGFLLTFCSGFAYLVFCVVFAFILRSVVAGLLPVFCMSSRSAGHLDQRSTWSAILTAGSLFAELLLKSHRRKYSPLTRKPTEHSLHSPEHFLHSSGNILYTYTEHFLHSYRTFFTLITAGTVDFPGFRFF